MTYTHLTYDLLCHVSELTLFFGFFLYIILLSLPTAFSFDWIKRATSYLIWFTYTFSLLKNGILNTTNFFDHLVSNFEIFWTKILLLISVFLIHFQLYKVENELKEKFHLLLISITLGCNLLVHANSFFTYIIGSELIALSSYSLAAFSFNQASSLTAVKYFMYGTLSTGLTLFGISWIYGYTDTLYFIKFQNKDILFSLFFMLLLANLLFKLVSFPFHLWAPSFYQNTPNIVLSILTSLPKIASGYILMKLLRFYQNEMICIYLGLLASLSIIWGTSGATIQKDFKKIMAYSSIVNSGFYISLSLINSNYQFKPFLIFGISQVLANIAIFKITEDFNLPSFLITQWNGLYKKSFLYTFTLLLCLTSLVGLPPLAGFLGKLLIFINLLTQSNIATTFNYVLVLFLLVSTLFSLYFYLLPLHHLIVIETEKRILPLRINLTDALFAILIIVNLILIFVAFGELGKYFEIK